MDMDTMDMSGILLYKGFLSMLTEGYFSLFF